MSIELFKKAMWWNASQNKPHDCLILGNTNTVLNLGWFQEIDNQYELTQLGLKKFKAWKVNNNIENETNE